MSPWLNDQAIEGLEELSDFALQDRLWSGRAKGEMSSFDEAVCCVFDNGQITKMLDKQQLPQALHELFTELDQAVTKVFDANPHPAFVQHEPAMKQVRELASRILRLAGTDGRL